jgi:hypothetical protein
VISDNNRHPQHAAGQLMVSQATVEPAVSAAGASWSSTLAVPAALLDDFPSCEQSLFSTIPETVNDPTFGQQQIHSVNSPLPPFEELSPYPQPGSMSSTYSASPQEGFFTNANPGTLDDNTVQQSGSSKVR